MRSHDTIKPSVLDRRDGSERPIGIVNTADGGKFGVIERLHAQRDACDTNLGKRSGKLGGQRLGIGLAGKLNGGAPRTNTPRQLHQALPCQRRRTAANIDGADLVKGPSLAKSIEARDTTAQNRHRAQRSGRTEQNCASQSRSTGTFGHKTARARTAR